MTQHWKDDFFQRSEYLYITPNFTYILVKEY